MRNSIRHQVYRDDRESIAAMNSRQIGRQLLREYVEPPTRGKVSLLCIIIITDIQSFNPAFAFNFGY